MSTRFSIIITAVSAFLCCALNAAGQDEGEESFPHNISSRVRYTPSSSVKNLSGKIGIFETEDEYSYELKVFGKLPLTFSLGAQYIDIESSADEIELPSYLTGMSADVKAILPFFKLRETYLLLGVTPSFYSDGWDFGASAFRIPSRYLLIYRPTPQWTLVGGVALYPLHKDKVLPVLGFIYKPNDRLTFNITPEDPSITYALNDKVSLFAEGDLSIDEFEIDEPGTKDVVLRYDEWHAGGGVEVKFNKFFKASLSAGGIFDRSLEYSDDRAKASLKDGLYTELKIAVKF